MYKNELYNFLAKFVFDQTGIFYGEKDYYRLDSRIDKMLKCFEISDENELLQQLKTNKDQKFQSQVIDLCTNNETYFFRDEKPFNALKKHILPYLLDEKKQSQINIWSCASSSGQEPLSILMSIKENYPQFDQFNIDATDISKTILEKAQSGVYNSLEAQRGLPIQLLVKYFTQVENNCWQVKPEILAKIKYSEFNLFSKNFPINKYDVIFCRNVLIYQNQENKNKILENLYTSLKPGGYLLMGAGESLIGSQIKLDQESLEGTMVFRKAELNSAKVA